MIVRERDASRLGVTPWLIEPLGLRDVFVHPSLYQMAAQSPGSAAAQFVRRLRALGVSVHAIEPGDGLAFGQARVTAIFDDGGAMSLRVRAANRPVLLAGAARVSVPGEPGGVPAALECNDPAALAAARPDLLIVSTKGVGADKAALWPWRDGAAWLTLDRFGRVVHGTLRDPPRPVDEPLP